MGLRSAPLDIKAVFHVDGELAADDRLYAVARCLLGKFEGDEEIVRIGNRNGRLVVGAGLGKNLLERQRPFQQRVGGMDSQMDKFRATGRSRCLRVSAPGCICHSTCPAISGIVRFSDAGRAESRAKGALSTLLACGRAKRPDSHHGKGHTAKPLPARRAAGQEPRRRRYIAMTIRDRLATKVTMEAKAAASRM